MKKEPLWYLECKESRIHRKTIESPQEYSCKLFADCEIIVDTSLIDEDDFGTKEITIEQYISEYVQDKGDFDDLIRSNCDLTINNCMKGIFIGVRDLIVENGMKIFIHEKTYNCI